MTKKVIVGLSGGVDSSVAAYLLKQQGYEVHCIFMKNWDEALNNDVLGNPNKDSLKCSAEVDFADAKKIAEQLDLPLTRVDFSKEYWDQVFEDFLKEYKEGRTPNPDLFCNRNIKFGELTNHVNKNFGKDWMIATGHYAAISHEGSTRLLVAKDENKDQTYFLSQVKKENLKNVLFPLGELKKDEVRKIAQENNLITADKKDSTGICFIGEREFKLFLNNYIKKKEGPIIDIQTNEVVGNHNGAYFYTIGQNKNLGLGGQEKKYFVCKKDMSKNIIYVTTSEDLQNIYFDGCQIEQVNIITSQKLEDEFECKAKFRYRQPYQDVILNIKTNTVKFKNPIKAIAPGQGAVFYLGGECIIGSIIKKAN